MSYEGYEEYLCPVGHYWTIDASILTYGNNSDRRKAVICPICGQFASHHCSVDETNGIDENDSSTLPGPKKEVGFNDILRQDRHGNKYFESVPCYKPDMSACRWYVIVSPRVIEKNDVQVLAENLKSQLAEYHSLILTDAQEVVLNLLLKELVSLFEFKSEQELTVAEVGQIELMLRRHLYVIFQAGD